jgi:hypothetical protein
MSVKICSLQNIFFSCNSHIFAFSHFWDILSMADVAFAMLNKFTQNNAYKLQFQWVLDDPFPSKIIFP